MIAASQGDSPAANIADMFTSVRASWYRPIFYLSIYLNWLTFGMDPFGYHVFNIALHIATTIGVYLLIARLTGSGGPALAGSAFFAIFAYHPESVFWISGRNNILAALFVVHATLFYLLGGRWLVPSVLFYAFGLMSKETAGSLPMALLAYELLYRRTGFLSSGWRRLAPFLAVLLAYLPLRLAGGTPYSPQVTATGIASHLAYYLGSPFVIVPGDFLSKDAAASWASQPLLPVVTALLSAIPLGLLGTLWIRCGLRGAKVAIFGVAWLLGGSLPVILVVAERLTYLPAVGAAVVVAGLCRGVLPGDAPRAGRLKLAVAGCLGLVLMANLLAFAWRAHWWTESARLSRAVLDQVQAFYPQLPAESSLAFLNLPDTLHLAIAFQNSMPAALRLLYREPSLQAYTSYDKERVLADAAEAERHLRDKGVPLSRVLVYRGGILQELWGPMD